jgi:DNA-binding transcriptional ArsR family regulator
MAADVDETAAAAVFRALADPTRRQILQALRKGELPAGVIAARFPISGPSVSRHLAVLKAAGLVTERREANRVIYSLVPERLAVCVGTFVSAVCPEQVLVRHQGKKKAKAAGKARAPEKVSAKAVPVRMSSEKPSGKNKRRRGPDKPSSAKSEPDQPSSAQSEPDKPGPDKPAPDKPAPDKPAPELADANSSQLSATV